MNKTFEEAMAFRHACKAFDENKKVSDEDMKFILNAGRTSPSSYGLEFTKYLVISNDDLKNKIKDASANQEQVYNCSHLIIILVCVDDAKIDTGIPEQRFKRFIPKDKLDFFVGMYKDFTSANLYNNEKIYSWTSKQAYLCAGNIMTAAAVKGIDSCAIEGFDKNKVEEIIDLDTSVEQVSLVLPIGYRIQEQSIQTRLDFDEVVRFIS